MLQEKKIKRDVAQKISAIEILNGNFQETEYGTLALSANGKLVRRANLLATVVAKNDSEGQKSAVVDDGTAQIRLRFFDNEWLFEKAGVGDFVLIIGRPRRFGGESYIAPEILKPAKDVKWADVRRLELLVLAAKAKRTAGDVKEVQSGITATAAVKGENLEDSELDAVSRDKVEICRIIKALDAGRGAEITEVVTKFSGDSDSDGDSGYAERLVKDMIKSGDIFEALPGRLKVLE